MRILYVVCVIGTLHSVLLCCMGGYWVVLILTISYAYNRFMVYHNSPISMILLRRSDIDESSRSERKSILCKILYQSDGTKSLKNTNPTQ